MTAKKLDGRIVAAQIKEEIKTSVKALQNQGKPPPGLAVVLVGYDAASEIYVKNKRKACIDVGFNSYAYDLPSNTSERELLELIEKLNNDLNIHGILVQLPLPNHIDANKIIDAINPKKDVDGFHPYNIGRLMQRNPALRPCTPFGIIKLLEYYDVRLAGINSCVIGASNIVGRPMALELLLSKATVTICHRFTKNLEDHVRNSELIVVATGVKNIVDPNWLHDKHIIVDVGIHRRENGQIHGDIDFVKAEEKVAMITPVPGGVGPMTICTLLLNTLLAAS